MDLLCPLRCLCGTVRGFEKQVNMFWCLQRPGIGPKTKFLLRPFISDSEAAETADFMLRQAIPAELLCRQIRQRIPRLLSMIPESIAEIF
jgi:hypothetical protein